MLFTDCDFITPDELAMVEPDVLDISKTEKITLDGDTGVIRNAIGEASLDLMNLLQSFGYATLPLDVTMSHHMAVMNTGMPWTNMTRYGLGQIVVSGIRPGIWSALKRWVVYRTLSNFYRSASERRVNDRYQIKWERYEREIDTRYLPMLMAEGIPVVTNPLPCPGAIHEPGVGLWGDANVSHEAPGAGVPAELQMDVAITWVGATAESHPSATITHTVPMDNVLKVDITSLNPPNGTIDPSLRHDCPYSTMAATGWNVYAGAGGVLYRQNALPVAIATKTFSLAQPFVTSGTAVGQGQAPDGRATISRTIFRG